MTLKAKRSHLNFLKILLCIFLIYILIGNSTGQNECKKHEQCGKCIQTKNCAWCTKEDFPNERCVEVSSGLYNLCTEKFIFNPETIFNIQESENLTRNKLKNQNIEDNENLKIVQIKPQRVSLKLRPNEVYKLNFKYAKADDYPVDLYYLMDLSRSMLDHKEKLSALGNKLADAMKSVTRNFRLGFGSFIDKVLMPYTSLMEEKLKNPCSAGLDCASPYSFIHHMNLSANATKFEIEVKNAKVSANIDSPEGGLDAMMQVAVCRQEIGWRPSAHRLIIYSSDAGFHYAGDGKLAGLIEPNDGKCHMKNNRYTHAEILDYPSVSHISSIIKSNAINVIFAVTKNISKTYMDLAKAIEGAQTVILSDQSDVARLIKDEYDKISSNFEITDDATLPIKIEYYTSCLDPNGEVKPQRKCYGLKDNTTLNFEARIQVTECPKDKSEWKQSIQISPVGVEEYLTVDLEIICSCDCENPKHETYEKNSIKCGGQGIYKCGLCDCNDKYTGRKCECSSDSIKTEISSTDCRPNNNTKVDCSGFGTCRCGVCECNKQQNPEEIISGRYCECDNFRCPRYNNLLCSGEDHGTCICGKCDCKEGWSGTDCNCKNSTDSCFPEPDSKICSGHGECKCGECKCDGRYSGLYCEKCLICEKHCNELKNCVECQAYKAGPLNDEECSKNCTYVNTEIVDKIQNDEENKLWVICKMIDETCEFIFEYKELSNDNFEVRAEKERKCSSQFTAATKEAAYVILPILALGILGLLSWKVVTTVHDKREYSKFEKDKLMAKWTKDDNPLYKEASSMYRNPGFNN